MKDPMGKFDISAASIIAMKTVLSGITDIDRELQELGDRVRATKDANIKLQEKFLAESHDVQQKYLAESKNHQDELDYVAGRVHKLSNRFYSLHETTMQVIDEVTGVGKEE